MIYLKLPLLESNYQYFILNMTVRMIFTERV